MAQPAEDRTDIRSGALCHLKATSTAPPLRYALRIASVCPATRANRRGTGSAGPGQNSLFILLPLPSSPPALQALHCYTQNNYFARPPAEVRREPEHHVEGRREEVPRNEVFVHPWQEEEVHHPHFWDNFIFGRILVTLPLGCLTLQIGGAPYYYYNGIYYQSVPGGYQEVYPPAGAVVPQPPEGAIAVAAGGLIYYYAGSAFYLQQPDGTFAIAPPPLGVVVPVLPPGAVQVFVNGTIAYQFNGICNEPVFVNGVTQYETSRP
jgi:hypothetical protein